MWAELISIIVLLDSSSDEEEEVESWESRDNSPGTGDSSSVEDNNSSLAEADPTSLLDSLPYSSMQTIIAVQKYDNFLNSVQPST